jgi:cell division protein FtsB
MTKCAGDHAAMFRKPKLFDLLTFFGCCALLAWFGWHGLEGPRGKDNYARLKTELAAQEEALAAVREKREALEARVQLMRPESVDPDMASELVRDMLGYEKNNSILVKFN